MLKWVKDDGDTVLFMFDAYLATYLSANGLHIWILTTATSLSRLVIYSVLQELGLWSPRTGMWSVYGRSPSNLFLYQWEQDKIGSGGVTTELIRLFAVISLSSPRNGSRLDWIWKLRTSPRAKSLVWKIMLDIVSIRSKLVERGMQINAVCWLCALKEESCEHVFISAPLHGRLGERGARIWKARLSRSSMTYCHV